MMSEVWGPLRVPEGESLRREIGGVAFWTRVSDDEWQIAHSYGIDSTVGGFSGLMIDGSDSPELDWTRYVTASNDTVELQPALPDRPVVVRPRSPIVVLPGQSGRFFLSVPLWVRFVSSSTGRPTTMVEIPSQNLSSTWFGSMETGDLCYAVDSRLLRAIPETDADDAYARCEVEIRNSSREPLRFERLCVHVEHMHLYEGEGKFWANQLRVVFKGAEQVSQLTYLPGPPGAASGALAVCEPRRVLDQNIFKRSFNLIREITGI